MKKLLLAIMVALVSSVGFGVTYYTDNESGKGCMTDATDLNQWRLDGDKKPSVLPTADDWVYIRKGYSVKIPAANAATSLAVLSPVKYIQFADNTSKMEVEVAEGADLSLGAPLKANTDGAYNGILTKTGLGTLHLSNNCSNYVANTFRCYKFDVKEGILRFPEFVNPAGKTDSDYKMRMNINHVNVDEGATVMFTRLMGDNWTAINYLTGYGTVSNYASKTEVRIGGACDFYGNTKGTSVTYFNNGKPNFWGTNSTYSGAYLLMYGYGSWDKAVTGVKYIGAYDEPSSVGKNYVQFNVHGGVIKYLGDGERATKTFNSIAHSSGEFAGFDGGITGRLDLAGNISPAGDTSTKNMMLGLGGSNMYPCKVSGNINTVGGGAGFSVFKAGTGTWCLADPASVSSFGNHEIFGAIRVDEGTLQFTSATRRGIYTSIGAGDKLFQPDAGKVWTEYPTVDYNFMLGTATTEGALEYTGTNAVDMTDRPFAMFGNAKLINNTECRSYYRALPPQGTGNRTLTLDGTSTKGNKVFDITDNADAKISVVKSGTGKWILGGDQTFSGDLVVTGGTLVVENLDQRYTWFKLQIKMNQDSVKTNAQGEYVYTYNPSNEGEFRFIGIYDKNGDLMTDALEIADNMNGAGVEPGQVGYDVIASWTEGSYGETWGADINPTNAFSVTQPFNKTGRTLTRTNGNLVWAVRRQLKGKATGVVKNVDKQETWIPLVWRLKDSVTAEAKSFDVGTMYGRENMAGFTCNPRIFSLEGSVDGCHWEDMNPAGGNYDITIDQFPALKNNSKFYFANVSLDRGATGSCRKHTGGTNVVGRSSTTYTLLNNVNCVKVGNGATLQAAGTMVGAKTLDNLELDTAANTIDGFKLAASGTLNVKAANTKVDLNLGTTFANNGDTLSNLTAWGLSINGAEQRLRKIEIENGKIIIRKPGLILILK